MQTEGSIKSALTLCHGWTLAVYSGCSSDGNLLFSLHPLQRMGANDCGCFCNKLAFSEPSRWDFKISDLEPLASASCCYFPSHCAHSLCYTKA
eukprot:scaffold248631_cov21-Tisochrysis_lutea.AAC.1